MSHTTPAESRVAVLVDCDNTAPDVLEHALRVVAQFGRVALALDALEAMFDRRAETFCLATSDSDFAYQQRSWNWRSRACRFWVLIQSCIWPGCGWRAIASRLVI